MEQLELLNKLKSLKKELRDNFGIEKIAVFGSYARNEAREDSDIAIIKMKEKNYFKRARAIYFLEEKLNKKVDMGYLDSIRKIIQNQIKKEMLYV